MAHLVVRGGTRLSGQVAVDGNKNAALPLLAACVLTPDTCELRNVAVANPRAANPRAATLSVTPHQFCGQGTISASLSGTLSAAW